MNASGFLTPSAAPEPPVPRLYHTSLLRDPLLYGVVLIGIAACAPFFRYVSSLGDEGVLLHGAVRILRGEKLYQDFFGILPPGGYLIITAWMKLFGLEFASARALAIGVIAAIAALVYLAARLASDSRRFAATIAVAWVVLSPGTLTVINHHWLTTAASMASAVCLLLVVEGVSPRGAAFAAGFFGGVAAMVTSTRGALLCTTVLAVLLTGPASRRVGLRAVAGMALFPTGMFLYVVANATLVAAVEGVVRYPLVHYPSVQLVPFGEGASPQHWVAIAFFPATFALAGLALVLDRFAPWRDPRFRVTLALAAVGFIGSYPRPDHVHLAFTLPLACPLFALAGRSLPFSGRIALGTVFGGLGLLGLVGAISSVVTVSRSPAVPTSRGLIVADSDLPARDVANLMLQLDRIPSGSGFFYPYSPLLAYLTGRRHVAPVDVMLPGYTSAGQFHQACLQVAAEAEYVVIDRQWTSAFIRRVFPAIRDPDPPEKQHLESALRDTFDRIYISTRFELRQRSPHAAGGICGPA